MLPLFPQSRVAEGEKEFKNITGTETFTVFDRVRADYISRRP